MKLTTLLTALTLTALTVTASPTLTNQKRAPCDCNNKKRDLNVAAEPVAALPILPSTDTKSTPDPSKDSCLKQLEQYGGYADLRCAGFGAPLELIDSYSGGEKAAIPTVRG
ncbi:hypothetical protein TWF506_004634 [Arthrobotrys conoides]|uniref:Uncharacterized protein n=1 Tax=Arthrobotrys conoides TaxID=74498 RepID=A0AAN8N007_9PEZI